MTLLNTHFSSCFPDFLLLFVDLLIVRLAWFDVCLAVTSSDWSIDWPIDLLRVLTTWDVNLFNVTNCMRTAGWIASSGRKCRRVFLQCHWRLMPRCMLVIPAWPWYHRQLVHIRLAQFMFVSVHATIPVDVQTELSCSLVSFCFIWWQVCKVMVGFKFVEFFWGYGIIARAVGEGIPLPRRTHSGSGVCIQITDMQSISGWLPKFNWFFLFHGYISHKIFMKLWSPVFTWRG